MPTTMRSLPLLVCLSVAAACGRAGQGGPASGLIAVGSIGSPCDINSECSDGTPPQCLGTISGGYCTMTCTTSKDCPAGSSCTVASPAFGRGAVCMLDCASAANCPTSSPCVSSSPGAPEVCLPPACQADSDCLPGQSCDVSDAQCVAGTPDAGTAVIDGGAMDGGTGDGGVADGG